MLVGVIQDIKTTSTGKRTLWYVCTPGILTANTVVWYSNPESCVGLWFILIYFSSIVKQAFFFMLITLESVPRINQYLAMRVNFLQYYQTSNIDFERYMYELVVHVGLRPLSLLHVYRSSVSGEPSHRPG